MARIGDSFQKTLEVQWPLRLEVETGSGDISVRRGEDGILTITAPARIAAELDTGSGDITVIRAGGEVNADAGSGDVRIEEMKEDGLWELFSHKEHEKYWYLGGYG